MVAINKPVEQSYRHYLALTRDSTAAAVLALAAQIAALSPIGNLPAESGRLLKVAEAARRMNVGKATVYELIASGKLPAHRVGNGRGTIRVRPEDLAAFEQSSLPAAGDAGDWSLARIRELA